MDYTKYQDVKVEVKDGIALVTFNRPQRNNAVTSKMHTEIVDIFYQLRHDPDVYAVVTTGAGRHYLTGGEPDMLQGTRPSVPDTSGEGGAIVRNLIELDKPLIGAVNGMAAGVGSQIALASDMVFGHEWTRFTDGHSRVGLAAGDGGVVFWTLRVGVARARRYLMTGDVVGAEEALQVGLIDKLVPQDKLLPEAMAYAKRLAEGPIYAMRLTKHALNAFYRLSADTAFDYSSLAEFITIRGEEAQEGINALREKRAPKYH